jgi:hypothetical protein
MVASRPRDICSVKYCPLCMQSTLGWSASAMIHRWRAPNGAIREHGCVMYDTRNMFNPTIKKIDEIVREIMSIKTDYNTNDSHGYLLFLDQQCYAYHLSHTHVRAVAVSQAFGTSQ